MPSICQNQNGRGKSNFGDTPSLISKTTQLLYMYKDFQKTFRPGKFSGSYPSLVKLFLSLNLQQETRLIKTIKHGAKFWAFFLSIVDYMKSEILGFQK